MIYAFLGPESTGKTTLATEIAERKGGVYVPEYARTYSEDIKLDYSYEDILEIAKGQFKHEIEAIDNHPDKDIFCDTELITIEIWLEYFGYEVPNWISNAIYQSSINQYFLCDIDIPWVKDELRVNEHDREDILKLFQRKLNFYNKNWRLISGKGENRLNYLLEIMNT